MKCPRCGGRLIVESIEEETEVVRDYVGAVFDEKFKVVRCRCEKCGRAVVIR